MQPNDICGVDSDKCKRACGGGGAPVCAQRCTTFRGRCTIVQNLSCLLLLCDARLIAFNMFQSTFYSTNTTFHSLLIYHVILSIQTRIHPSQIQSQLDTVDLVECVDVSDNACDGGAKLELLVVSSEFQGKPPLARHRMVNAAVSDLMQEIHALVIQAWTPDQYHAKLNQNHAP